MRNGCVLVSACAGTASRCASSVGPWYQGMCSLGRTTLSPRSAESGITVTSLVPAGLSLANDAPAGGTTRVRITISLAYDPGDAGMVRYPIRSVRLEVSADGGRTWQVVRVTGHGLTRWAQVPDPASGYVTIRTVVTDVRGDTSTQTVYQAYGVAASAG